MDSDERPPRNGETSRNDQDESAFRADDAHIRNDEHTPRDKQHDFDTGHGHGGESDPFGDFTEELKLLAETVLERIEPVLRRAAAEDRPEWSSCGWCPICAVTALIRGEQHDVLTTVAEHGTAIVTVLREALAGVPVQPVWFDAADSADPSGSAQAESGTGRPGSRADRSADRRGGSGYADIPVTIKP